MKKIIVAATLLLASVDIKASAMDYVINGAAIGLAASITAYTFYQENKTDKFIQEKLKTPLSEKSCELARCINSPANNKYDMRIFTTGMAIGTVGCVAYSQSASYSMITAATTILAIPMLKQRKKLARKLN